MADPRLTVSPKELAILTSSGVPAISLLDACRGCDEDEDEYDIDSDEPDQVGRSRTNTGKAAAAATASTASTDSAPAQSGFLSRLGRTFGGKLGLGQIDNSLNLLGSVKNSGRTVVVATSKSDWPHSVTDEEDLYAHTISTAYDKHLKALDSIKASTSTGTRSNGTNGHTLSSNGSMPNGSRRNVPGVDGLGDGLTKDGQERAHNITILCGNMHPYEEAHATGSEKRESIFIFPDYKMVTHLPSSSAGELVSEHLSPRLLMPSGSNPTSELASYILPYQATILICSHKKRDKRCHITADPLIAALSQAIEELGDNWHVDRHGDEEHIFSPMLIKENDTPESIERRKQDLVDLRKDKESDKHVGIFKVSHVGGHKFAGQLLIWFPNGAQVWYGRVTPQDCKVIVRETFKKGRVVADLMRGGTALAHRNGSVWEW